METEEAHLHPSDPYVPETSRVTILGVKITLEEHMAEVRYRQGSGNGGVSSANGTTMYEVEGSEEGGEERQAVVRW